MIQVFNDVLPPIPTARGRFITVNSYVCVFEEVSQYKDGVLPKLSGRRRVGVLSEG